MTPFECYSTFSALRLHFLEDYDYFKYAGKLNVTADAFDQRDDRVLFVKLSRRVSDMQDLEDLIVSNVAAGSSKAWVQHYLEPRAWDIKTKWLDNVSNIATIVNKETLAIASLPDVEFKNLLTPIDGGHPLLFVLFLSDEISLETMIVYDALFKCFDRWNNQVIDDVIWPSTFKFIEKYKPFLKFNKTNCRIAIKKGFKGELLDG